MPDSPAAVTSGRTDPADAADLTDLSDPAAQAAAVWLLARATDALLADVRAVDDGAARAPSRLPGWSRGHVLTHVARNADGMVNLVTSARTGDHVAMYGPGPARDDDIEAGAHRTPGELEADLESSAERFLAALAELPADRLGATVSGRAGTTLPAHDIVWMRLREVVYHHVDLGTGRTFADVPSNVVARGLAESGPRMEAGGAAPMTWLATDLGLTVEVAGGGPVVRGTAAELLAWVTGRGDGLAGDRPRLPSWG